MFRRNPANIPNPGNTPGQTVQNVANHKTGSREQSKARKTTKVISALAGLSFLGTGIWGGETLGHIPSDSGPNRTQQILDQGKADERAFHCTIDWNSVNQQLNPDGSENITLGLTAANGPSAIVNFGMVYKNAKGEWVSAGAISDKGGDNHDHPVHALMAPEAIGHPVGIYAIGSTASNTLCGEFRGEFHGATITVNDHDANGQPLPQPQLELTPQGDFPRDVSPSIFEGN